mmetsp:Transcript_115340/g.200137  ORF Transcript_115340/g.200137 Transcript_115340/m.200137 type:complete len:125 (-) Transcript_115340:13-387(-)
MLPKQRLMLQRQSIWRRRVRMRPRCRVSKAPRVTRRPKKGEAESSRGTKFGELKALYSKLEAGEAECNYFTINYPLRRSNRLIEIDGLTKARAILEGGRFTKPKDPNREIKPGDALLQRARRHS